MGGVPGVLEWLGISVHLWAKYWRDSHLQFIAAFVVGCTSSCARLTVNTSSVERMYIDMCNTVFRHRLNSLTSDRVLELRFELFVKITGRVWLDLRAALSIVNYLLWDESFSAVTSALASFGSLSEQLIGIVDLLLRGEIVQLFYFLLSLNNCVNHNLVSLWFLDLAHFCWRANLVPVFANFPEDMWNWRANLVPIFANFPEDMCKWWVTISVNLLSKWWVSIYVVTISAPISAQDMCKLTGSPYPPILRAGSCASLLGHHSPPISAKSGF